MKTRASLFLGPSLVALTAFAGMAGAQTPPPGYEPPPGYQQEQYQQQQQYPQQQYPQQQYPQQQYPQQQYPQQQYPQQYQPAPTYTPQPAPAYVPPPVLARPRRLGFFLGGSVGLGATATDSGIGKDGGGFAFAGHLGFMLTPRFGLLVEGSGVALSLEDDYGDNTTQTTAMGLIGAQLWLTDVLWLRGGLGWGSMSWSNDYNGTYADTESGAAVMLAGGIDLLNTPNMTLDLHGRWSYVQIGDSDFGATNLAVQIGLNWYSTVF